MNAIPVENVYANPEQPRKEFNRTELEKLAESISSDGLIQPVIVTKTDSGYMLIDGERRWRAHKILGLEKIECIFREDIDPEDHHLLSLIANFHRENHTPMETSDALSRERKRGTNVEDLAKAIGKSTAYVYQHLSLQNLHPKLQKMVSSGRSGKNVIRVGIAVELSKVPMTKQIWVHSESQNKSSGESKKKFIRQYQEKDPNKPGKVIRFRPKDDATVLLNFASRTSERVERFVLMPVGDFKAILANMTSGEISMIVDELLESSNQLNELADSIRNLS